VDWWVRLRSHPDMAICHGCLGGLDAQRDGQLQLVAGCGAIYIHCPDADEVAADWRQAGLMVDGPHTQEYGRREGSVTDPDGNVIRFGSPIRSA
jgi:predicted enzyme related to lactoylglutathione lyase